MQNSFELPLLKYPYNGKSKYLFDKIMIIGYTQSFMNKNTPYDNIALSRTIDYNINKTNSKDDIYGKEKLSISKSLIGGSPRKTLKPATPDTVLRPQQILQQRERERETKYIQRIELPEYPIVLGEIASDYSKQVITNETIISLIFPSLPKISKLNIGDENKSEENVVFSFNPVLENSKVSTNGYGFIYYEIYKGYSYPKVVFFLSEYPYFSSFRDIGINISQTANSIYPLEYILYNMVNYTPSPINFSIKLQPFSHIHNKPPTLFPQLTCYPLFSFDLSELFNVLPYEMIVEIFFFTVLENDIIFFSKNNEILTIVMYIFANLNFPCNDSTYYWQILSVSQFTFVNDASPFVSKTCSCMIGINDSYDPIIQTTSKIKEHFIVDLDNRTLEYKYNEDKANLNEVSTNKKLQDYIKRAIREKCNQDDMLAQAILLFYKDLKVIGDKITHTTNYNNNSLGVPRFFKQMNKNIQTNNKTIQNVFYLFMIQILKIYTKNYSLLNLSEKDMSSISYSDLRANSNKNKEKDMFYISLDTNNIQKGFKSDELLFYDKFIQSSKYNQFMISYMQYHDSIDLFKIPLIISEELIYWLNIKHNIRLINCFDLMDKLYLNNSTLEVNFKSFYYEFNEEKSNLFQMKRKTSKLSTKLKNKPLDINIKNIIPYHYSISNIDCTEREKLFPSIKELNNHCIQTIDFYRIQNEIEVKLMEQNEIRYKDLLCNCIILVFGLTREVCESNSLNQIYLFKTSFSSVRINMRKYYSMLLNICLRLTKKNNAFSFQQFYLMINSLRDNISIIPNEELLKLMNQIGYANNSSINNNNNCSIMMNDNCNELREYSIEQEIISDIAIKINANTQNTIIKNIISSAEVRNWDKNIKISFHDKDVKPCLNLQLNKSNSIEQGIIKLSKVYSIKKLYDKSNELMHDYYQSLDFEKVNRKRLSDIILNLLLYVNNTKWHSIEQKSSFIQLLFDILLLVYFKGKKSVMEVPCFVLQIILS